ncbi:hypothetical protein [Amycolatopsis sp. GM8]|uniref:allene oxide cyclase barrel-like domain-containing protein n=1 Tax=Amycolatopsis sp. GM8 TaxID=2896530 RepID=UPI001F3424B5|nr:hypothetical protein [Amycolatopsis sp. GM8]
MNSLVLSTFAVPPAAGSAEVSALEDGGNSLILRDLTEKVTAYESTNPDMTGTTPTESDFATVKLDMFAPSGELIGHTTGAGRMLFKQDNGEFVGYFGERISLLDGNIIRAGGLVDDARLTAGESATIPAVVVAGPLRGAIGYRQFRPVVLETHDTYTSSIVLYRK